MKWLREDGFIECSCAAWWPQGEMTCSRGGRGIMCKYLVDITFKVECPVVQCPLWKEMCSEWKPATAEQQQQQQLYYSPALNQFCSLSHHQQHLHPGAKLHFEHKIAQQSVAFERQIYLRWNCSPSQSGRFPMRTFLWWVTVAPRHCAAAMWWQRGRKKKSLATLQLAGLLFQPVFYHETVLNPTTK